MPGIKHLIDCHCFLRIYKTNEKIIYHKFPVYSKINNDTGKIIPKYVQCNNCEAVHKVYEIKKSEIFAGKDQTESLQTIDDLKISLPNELVKIFKNYKKDIADYEHAIDIIQQKEWGSQIVLKRDIINEMYQVKYLIILSETRYEIKNEIINDTIII